MPIEPKTQMCELQLSAGTARVVTPARLTPADLAKLHAVIDLLGMDIAPSKPEERGAE